MRDPSSPIRAMPVSVMKATPRPFAVHRVPKGRDAFAASVVSGRALDPSRFAAQSTKVPEGVCLQYASRPLAESSGALRGPLGDAPTPAIASPPSTVA